MEPEPVFSLVFSPTPSSVIVAEPVVHQIGRRGFKS